jgi:hypothetical protein
MSVNVSTRQLADPDFPRDVRAAIDDAGIDPSCLTLEITEHLLLDNGDLMQQRLRALKEIGVRLAIDDIGTGYSALSHLQTFPVDVLKIDRLFVSGIDRDPERARLVHGIARPRPRAGPLGPRHRRDGPQPATLGRERGHRGGRRGRPDARVPLPVRAGLSLLQPVDAVSLDRLFADDTTLMEVA